MRDADRGYKYGVGVGFVWAAAALVKGRVSLVPVSEASDLN